MKELTHFEEKVLTFSVQLMGAYRPEEDQQGVGHLQLEEKELTEDFTAMLYGMFGVYMSITGDEKQDIIGFTHMLNRLAIQHFAETGAFDESDDNEC